MGAECYIRIVDTAGASQAYITDYLSVKVVERVNEPGLLVFTLPEGSSGVAAVAMNSQAEVYRRNLSMGLDWTLEFVGIIRGIRWTTEDATTLTVVAPGVMWLLGTRTIAYAAGTSQRSEFSATNAERILKRLVQYNATASGTVVDGRKRAAVDGGGKLSGLYTVALQADGNLGTSLSVGAAWRNLLSTLQSVASIGGVDFDLVKTGATTFEFRTYLGQRGTDRTGTLQFSLERGNMAGPVFEDNRVQESTVALIGGQGEGAARAVEIVAGADYGATRDFETFGDGRNDSTTAALQGVGAEILFDQRARPAFSFDVLQVPASYYGVHYFLGDIVPAYYRGATYPQKIVGVTLEYVPEGDEVVEVEAQTW